MFLDAWRTPKLREAFHFRLDDGTPVLARPLRPEDGPRLREGFARLSQLARRRRGFHDVTQLSDEQLHQLTRLDQKQHAAWGCVNLEKPEEPGVGVARYSVLNGDARAAEVAITIADDYQGRGAGMLLHACLHLTAHAAGIRRFYYDVASDNERFIQQIRSLGGQFEGRAENIDRLSLPVYHRAADVPRHSRNGRRFAEILIKLGRAPAAAA
jgi:RimJ/RimL family protein N-acetyltransferase